MKLSVSLSDEDVAVLDNYIERAGLPSRSAGVQHAIQMLRYPALEDDYAGAWAEWFENGDAEVWDSSLSDGVVDASR